MDPAHEIQLSLLDVKFLKKQRGSATGRRNKSKCRESGSRATSCLFSSWGATFSLVVIYSNKPQSSHFKTECTAFIGRLLSSSGVVFPSLLMHVFPVLQEESGVKPDATGPKTRSGPSTEDLPSASKQVQSPKSCILV